MTEKIFCDKCGKEIIDQNEIARIEWSYYQPESHLCESCEKLALQWLGKKVEE